MKTEKSVFYLVYYGESDSSERFTSWNEASRFIKYLLDSNYQVRNVGKEKEK
jgi:hypothetical protein